MSYISGPSSGGVNKYANIMYRDTSSKAQMVGLHAQVVPPVDTNFKINLYPSSLDFSAIKGGKPKEQKVRLDNKDLSEYKVTLLDYPQEFFKVKLDKKLKPGKSIQLEVKPVKSLPEEGLKRSLTFELEGKEKTRITVPLVFSIPTTPTAPK